MKNVIIILILLIITVAIICYLVRAKKRGETCIGCPYAKQCASKGNGGCSCSAPNTDNKNIHD